MILLQNRNLDPKYNLAFEECALKEFSTRKSIVFFWQNRKAVIIGRNQDYYREINSIYVDKNNIQVIRRISGGGAVFQDLGNINFTFITNLNGEHSYKEMIWPILTFLNSLGVPALFSGRNDIVVANKKISGSAQYIYKDRIMHHGTILFDVNMEMLSACLNPDPTKYLAKGIPSVRARVSNIKQFLTRKIDVKNFISKLEDHFVMKGYERVTMDEAFIRKVVNLVKEKYATDKWNINAGPSWQLSKRVRKFERRFKEGLLSISAQIIGERIQVISFKGDFLSRKDINTIENDLEGATIDEVDEVLNKYTISEYFGSLEKKAILNAIKHLFD